MSRWLSLLALVLSGCRSPYAIPRGEASSDPKELAPYVQAVEGWRPRSFVVSHRVLLTTYGGQYDFIGRLKVDRDNGFHGAGFGDLGGKLFELRRQGDAVEIPLRPDGLPEGPLREGVAEELAAAFLLPRGTASLWRHDGLVDLIYDRDEHSLVYRFAPGDRSPRAALLVEDGAIDSELSFSAAPPQLRVENSAWHYSLEATELELTPVAGGHP